MTEIPLKSVNIDGGMIAFSVSVDIIEESRPLEAKERQGMLGKKGKAMKVRKR